MEMLQLIASFSGISLGVVSLTAAIFTRMSAMAFFLPGLGERVVSMRIRLTVAMAITFVLLPILMDQIKPAAPTLSSLAVLLGAEAVTGALLGFSIRVIIFVMQLAGAIASQSLSLTQLFGTGITSQPESPMATLFVMTGTVLALSAGLHTKAISVLIVSYDLVPLGIFPGASLAGEWAAERAAFVFSAALSLSLPFVVLGFVYNLAIGAANRAMPQLMVAFVGVPAITFAGLILLALSTPVILSAWMTMVDQIIIILQGSSGL